MSTNRAGSETTAAPTAVTTPARKDTSTMRLYITPGSPYARMARIVVLEKQLQDRVAIELPLTRAEDSPYYRINPSGRVPYLLCDDGMGLEESAVICRYLDHLDGQPMFDVPTGAAGWEALRLGALATSLMDGLSVWLRELRRPANERSPGIIRHEAARAARLIDRWEVEIEQPWMNGPLNLAQIALVCALGIEARNPDFRWRSGHPKLSAWCDRVAARPSVASTAPPVG